MNNEIDIDICFALLNSIVSLFFIEALGFGRGLGALDLSATKLRKEMLILNPSLLSENEKEIIKNKFKPIVARKIKPIREEIVSKDRIEFDKVVLELFGFKGLRDDIVESLMKLFNIRISAIE